MDVGGAYLGDRNMFWEEPSVEAFDFGPIGLTVDDSPPFQMAVEAFKHVFFMHGLIFAEGRWPEN
jgi:hypothetical protein